MNSLLPEIIFHELPRFLPLKVIQCWMLTSKASVIDAKSILAEYKVFPSPNSYIMNFYIALDKKWEHWVIEFAHFIIHLHCQRDLDTSLQYAAQFNHLKIAYYLIANNAHIDGKIIYDLAYHNNLEFIKALANSKITFWNHCLFGAIRGQNYYLIDYAINKGADNWDKAFILSCSVGNLALVQKFTKPHSPFKIGLSRAAEHGHLHVILHLEQYLTDFPGMFKNAVHGEQLEILRYLVSKHTYDVNFYNWGLNRAMLHNNRQLALFFVEKGATKLEYINFYTDASLKREVEGLLKTKNECLIL